MWKEAICEVKALEESNRKEGSICKICYRWPYIQQISTTADHDKVKCQGKNSHPNALCHPFCGYIATIHKQKAKDKDENQGKYQHHQAFLSPLKHYSTHYVAAMAAKDMQNLDRDNLSNENNNQDDDKGEDQHHQDSPSLSKCCITHSVDALEARKFANSDSDTETEANILCCSCSSHHGKKLPPPPVTTILGWTRAGCTYLSSTVQDRLTLNNPSEVNNNQQNQSTLGGKDATNNDGGNGSLHLSLLASHDSEPTFIHNIRTKTYGKSTIIVSDQLLLKFQTKMMEVVSC